MKDKSYTRNVSALPKTHTGRQGSVKRRYNRLKVVLVDCGVSQKELIQYLGRSQAAVSRWCTNDAQPSIKMLYEIADFLDVDVCELLRPNR